MTNCGGHFQNPLENRKWKYSEICLKRNLGITETFTIPLIWTFDDVQLVNVRIKRNLWKNKIISLRFRYRQCYPSNEVWITREERILQPKIKISEGPYFILKYHQYCRWTRGPFCYSGSGSHPYPGFSGICIPLFLTYVRRYRHRIHRLCLFARNKNTKKVLLLATRLHESEN